MPGIFDTGIFDTGIFDTSGDPPVVLTGCPDLTTTLSLNADMTNTQASTSVSLTTTRVCD